jgi:hypothetical protein
MLGARSDSASVAARVPRAPIARQWSGGGRDWIVKEPGECGASGDRKQEVQPSKRGGQFLQLFWRFSRGRSCRSLVLE